MQDGTSYKHELEINTAKGDPSFVKGWVYSDAWNITSNTHYSRQAFGLQLEVYSKSPGNVRAILIINTVSWPSHTMFILSLTIKYFPR